MTASGLAVLTTDTKMPGVTETTVHLHLLHALEILTHLALDVVSKKLRVGAVDKVLLPVEHPDGDLELLRVLEDSDDLLHLIGLELTSTERHVDVGLLADHGREATANTLDAAEGVHDLLATVDVGVAHTKDVSEVRVRNERHRNDTKNKQRKTKTNKNKNKQTKKKKDKEKKNYKGFVLSVCNRHRQ